MTTLAEYIEKFNRAHDNMGRFSSAGGKGGGGGTGRGGVIGGGIDRHGKDQDFPIRGQQYRAASGGRIVKVPGSQARRNKDLEIASRRVAGGNKKPGKFARTLGRVVSLGATEKSTESATLGDWVEKFNQAHDNSGRFSSHGGKGGGPAKMPTSPNTTAGGLKAGATLHDTEPVHVTSVRLFKDGGNSMVNVRGRTTMGNKPFERDFAADQGVRISKSNHRRNAATGQYTRAGTGPAGQGSLYEMESRGTPVDYSRVPDQRAQAAALDGGVAVRSADQRRDLAAAGHAMPDGSYPTPTLGDLGRALDSYAGDAT